MPRDIASGLSKALSIEHLIRKGVRKGYDPTMFADVSSKELARASNIIDWNTSSQFMGDAIPPLFPRQAEILLNLFEDFCPKCSNPDFIDRDFRGKYLVGDMWDYPIDEILDNIQLLNFGKCKKCGRGRSQLETKSRFYGYSELAGCAGQRSSKCLVGGSLLLLKDKGMVTIESLFNTLPMTPNKEEFFNKKISLYAQDKFKQTDSLFYGGKRTCIKLTTHMGFSVEGTKSKHPIRVLNTQTGGLEWKKLKDIELGDTVVIVKGMNQWAKEAPVIDGFVVKSASNKKARYKYHVKLPHRLTPTFAELLGWVVSEGGCGQETECRITQKSRSLSKRIERLISVSMGKGAACLRRDKRNGRYTINIRSGAELGQLKTHLGLQGKSKDKSIPWCIFQSPKKLVKAFLKSLYEGNGYASNKNISYTTISPVFASNLQLLLLNFGIVSYIHKHVAKAYKAHKGVMSYTVTIAGKDQMQIFMKDIGFISTRKNSAVQKAIRQKKSSGMSNYLTIPGLADVVVFALTEIHNIVDERELTSVDTEGRTIILSSSHIMGYEVDHKMNNALSGVRGVTIPIVHRIVQAFEKSKYKQIFKGANVWDIMSNLSKIGDNYVFDTVVAKKNTGKHSVYDVSIPSGHDFWSNGFINHNTTLVGGMAAPYVLHQYLTLSDIPYKYFRLRPTTIHMNFVAFSATQARDTLWDQFDSSIQASPWFNDYFNLLDDEGDKHSIKLYDYKSTFLMFHHKRICAAFQPADYRSKRGLTRCFGAVDEIGWFNQIAKRGKVYVKANAEETYTYLRNSLSTIRVKCMELRESGIDDAPTAWMMNISSPTSKFDKIMQLVRQSERSRRIFGFHYATWEMNPDQKREYILREIEDPMQLANFDRDFGAIPPMSSNPAFPEELAREVISKCFILKPVAKGVIHDGDKKGHLTKWLKLKSKIVDNTLRVLAVDTGEMQNSFALSFISYDSKTEEFFVDAAFSITPDPKKNISINFSRMFSEIIVPIAQTYKVFCVVYDRWNSAQSVSDLEEMNIKAERISYPASEFSEFSKTVGDHRIKFPALDCDPDDLADSISPEMLDKHPYAYIALQLMTVRSLGRKIIKPEDQTLSDDLLRTIMLGVYYIEVNYEEFENSRRGDSGPAMKEGRVVAVLANRSGGMATSKPSKIAALTRGGSGGGSTVALGRGKMGVVVRK